MSWACPDGSWPGPARCRLWSRKRSWCLLPGLLLVGGEAEDFPLPVGVVETGVQGGDLGPPQALVVTPAEGDLGDLSGRAVVGGDDRPDVVLRAFRQHRPGQDPEEIDPGVAIVGCRLAGHVAGDEDDAGVGGQ